MAIDKIKVGSTNHDLEARTVIARDLKDSSTEIKSQIVFCTRAQYDALGTTVNSNNKIYFIKG